ncbi:MAG: class I SAM-dependent methyltransferase [Bacillota bacterium]
MTGVYAAFASVYDRLMADVDYPAWAAFYRTLLLKRGITGGAVCECACGTGSLTLLLQKHYEMTGVDISGEMLAIAAGKARRAGLSIPFVQTDMRSFSLHRPADGVLCTCDGVNYLPNEREVARFFRAAHQALRPGGALIFDVSTPYKLKTILGSHSVGEDAEDVAYLWQNKFYMKDCRVEMRLSIFKREEGGRYARIVEEQTQYGYTWPVLQTLLSAEGFTDISLYGDRILDAPKATERRFHIAATKKET